MSNLTLGIELEMRSKAIELVVPDAASRNGAESFGEPSWLYSLDCSDIYPWNKRAIACNELVELTLEVSYKTPTCAKVEFRTPVACTQSLSAFQQSTSAMLHAVHLFYYFAFACRGGTLADFVAFLGEARTRYHHWAALEYRPAESTDTTDPASLSKQLAFAAFDPHLLEPRLAPQLTFSAPLERVPALFSAPFGTFHEPGAAGARVAQPAVAFEAGIAPSAIEQTAVLLAQQFVEERLETSGQQARLARKLKGFFSIVFQLTLTAAFAGSIDRADVRSPRGPRGGTSKDNLRFLLRSRLDSLFRNGLSPADHRCAQLDSDSRALAVSLLQFLKNNMESGFVPIFNALEGNKKQRVLSRVCATSPLREDITSVFSSGGSSVSAPFSGCLDDVAVVEQREFDVTRKAPRVQSESTSSAAPRRQAPPRPPRSDRPARPTFDQGHLDRPVFEYRRFVGERDGYFRSAATFADALGDLYEKLRWLESETNPNHVATEGSSSAAYYRPLPDERLPWATGRQSGLASLWVQKPTGSSEVEAWWSSRQ